MTGAPPLAVSSANPTRIDRVSLMSTSSPLILVINSGSSSLKFAIYPVGERQPLASGLAERLGQNDASIRFDVDGTKKKGRAVAKTDHSRARSRRLMDFLKEHGWFERHRGDRPSRRQRRLSASPRAGDPHRRWT